MIAFAHGVPVRLALAIGSIALSIATARAENPQSSVDCMKANTPVESLICSDDALLRLELELSDAYRTALAAGNVDSASQAAWMAHLSKLCGSGDRRSCLHAVLEQRIADLRMSAVYGSWEPGGSAFEGDGNIEIKRETISWKTCRDVSYKVLSDQIVTTYPGLPEFSNLKQSGKWEVVLLRVADSACFEFERYIQFAIPADQRNHAEVIFYSSPAAFKKGYFGLSGYGKIGQEN